MTQVNKFRGFIFVWNNYTDEDVELFKNLDARFKCVGFETAPTTGTRHMQGYVYFKNQRHLNSIRTQFPLAHWEPAAADTLRNVLYCKKGDLCDDQEHPETQMYFFKGQYYKGNGVFWEDGTPPCTNQHIKGIIQAYLQMVDQFMEECPSPQIMQHCDTTIMRLLVDLLIHGNWDEDLILNDHDVDMVKLIQSLEDH